jgi:hypothetical protein
MTPVYKSAAFWTTVVSAIASVLVGLRYEQEATAIVGAAGIVIAYLVARGLVVQAELKRQTETQAKGLTAPKEPKF